MTYRDTAQGTDDERRLVVRDDGGDATVAIGVPRTNGPGHDWTVANGIGRNDLMIFAQNVLDVAHNLPWEEA